jgi:hypothetical protein
MSKQTDLINIPDAITVDGNTTYVDSNGQDAGYNPLQIGNTSNSNTIVQILSANNGIGTIHFGDAASGSGRYIGFMNYDHTIDQFQIGTNDSSRFKIDASGRVTTPNQPMFSAHGGAEQTSDAREVLQFTSANSNVGNHFSTSTYTFTAPVSGHYHFSFNLMAYAAENSRCQFAKNGSLIADQFYTEADGYAEYPRNSGSIIVQLSTNDTLRVDRNVQNSASERCHQNYRSFTGYLLG